MSFIACPHCQGTIGFGPVDNVPTSLPKPKRQTNGQITPLGTKVLQDIYKVITTIAPGRHTNEELYVAYASVATDRGARPVTRHSMAMGMSAYGLERWRNAKQRGWVIPDLQDEVKPLSISPAAKERRDAQDYRATVEAHRSGGGQSQPTAPAEKTWEDMSVQERIDAGMPPF